MDDSTEKCAALRIPTSDGVRAELIDEALNAGYREVGLNRVSGPDLDRLPEGRESDTGETGVPGLL